MLLCCSFASSSFTSRNPSESSLFVDRLGSIICTICRSSLISTQSGPAPETIYELEERPWIKVVMCLLTYFDWYCHLYDILCLLNKIFLAVDSEKLFASPQRAHFNFFVKHDKLELAFWLVCSMHVVIQVPQDGVEW